jgi:hypothetical protein
MGIDIVVETFFCYEGEIRHQETPRSEGAGSRTGPALFAFMRAGDGGQGERAAKGRDLCSILFLGVRVAILPLGFLRARAAILDAE